MTFQKWETHIKFPFFLEFKFKIHYISKNKNLINMRVQLNSSLTFKEMLRRSICSLAVLSAFILSWILVSYGVISKEQELIIPTVTVFIMAIWVLIRYSKRN